MRNVFVACALSLSALVGCAGSPSTPSTGEVLFGRSRLLERDHDRIKDQFAASRGMTRAQLDEMMRPLPPPEMPPGATLRIQPVPPGIVGTVPVQGYHRRDGTYVAPHYRTAPDGIKSNNLSYRGR